MRTLTLAAAALVGVTLAGCSSASPAPVASPSASRSLSRADVDGVYLDMARPLAPDVPDANLLDVRDHFCQVLDEDPREGKYLVAVAAMMKQPVFADHAGELAGLMVGSGCPQHADLVPGR
jgi:hypothetical protein